MILGAVILAAIIGLFVYQKVLEPMKFIWVTIFFYCNARFYNGFNTLWTMAGEMTLEKKIFDDRMAHGVCLTWYFNRRCPDPNTGRRQDPVIHSPLSVAPLIVLSIWFSVFFTRNTPRTLPPSQQNFSQVVGLVIANRRL